VRSHKQTRRRRLIVAVVAVVVAAMVADLAYVGVGVAVRMRNAARGFTEVRDELRAGRVADAEAALAAAAADAESAEGLLGHPTWKVVAALPLIGDDTDVVTALVAAGRLVADAGGPALEAAEVLDVRDGGLGADVYRGGRIDLDLLAEAAPLIDEARAMLDDAAEIVEDLGDPLLPPLDDAVTDASARVEEAQSSATKATALLDLLPRLTGGDGTRRYLLAFQALGEARGTGGVAGLYGVLKADDGRMKLGAIEPYSRLIFDPVSPATVPRWYVKAYGLQGALDQWPQANLSPSFPVDARVMLEMYRKSFRDELDGVIAVDAVVLAKLMESTGSISLPEFDRTVTAKNVIRLLSHDAYVDFATRKEQNEFLIALVRAFWDRIESGDLDFPALASGVGEMVQSRHLLVYSTDDEDEEVLEELGAAGALESLGQNLQMVFHNNYGVNKVDYYLRRAIQTEIEVASNGDLRVETSVRLRNRAPSGRESDLLGGKETRLAPGANRMTLNFVLPKGANAGRFLVDGEETVPAVQRDSGHPLVWDVLTIPPGGESIVKLVYEVPNGASIGADGGSMSFTFVPQAALDVDDFHLRVSAPGFALSTGESEGVDPGLRHRDEFLLNRQLSSDTTVDLLLERS
jgi:hypothetical protein